MWDYFDRKLPDVATTAKIAATFSDDPEFVRLRSINDRGFVFTWQLRFDPKSKDERDLEDIRELVSNVFQANLRAAHHDYGFQGTSRMFRSVHSTMKFIPLPKPRALKRKKAA